MRKYLPVCIFSGAAMLAAATAGFAQVNMPRPGWTLIEAAEEAAGAVLFNNHCAACHVQKQGEPVLAPSLTGVVGRPAGAASFPYSEALKKSGLTWTEENLRKWISDNAGLVKGTLMPHVSLKDPAETIYLVAYLKTLKAPAKP